MVENLTVQLAERSYALSFGATLVEEIRAMVADLHSAGRKVVVLTDANLAAEHADFFPEAFVGCPRLVVEAGEGTK